MATLFKKYVEHPEYPGSETRKIKMYIHYEKEQRRYRVCCVPVAIGDFFETSGAFTGFNDTLLTVERQSKKQLDKAINILAEREAKYIEWFKGKKVDL